MSPYEAFYQKSPSLECIRPFGCIVYVRVPDELRDRKFSDKAVKCCLLGYHGNSTSIYKVYNPSTATTRLAHDVRFLEDRFFQSSVFNNSTSLSTLPDTAPKPTRFVELDSSDDENDIYGLPITPSAPVQSPDSTTTIQPPVQPPPVETPAMNNTSSRVGRRCSLR
jgi:hypothetical protein